jgi:hypothetical protein
MSLPLHYEFEAFVFDDLSGEVFVQHTPKYDPAEKAAAEIFRRPIPDSLKGKAAFFEDCARYVQDHTELAECPRFAPKLALRFEQLRHRLKSCTDGLQTLEIAKEARSMVASLALRLAPASDVCIKRYGTPPGNVPEMLDFLPAPFKGQARAVDARRPDALATITALYEASLEAPQCRNARRLDRNFGPSPDALIEAAQNNQSFDTVRERMVTSQARASLADF